MNPISRFILRYYRDRHRIKQTRQFFFNDGDERGFGNVVFKMAEFFTFELNLTKR